MRKRSKKQVIPIDAGHERPDANIALESHRRLILPAPNSKGTHFAESTKAESTNAQSTKEGHNGLTVWLTGLSGSGKSSIARALHKELLARRIRAEVLDGDELRKHLNRDLGFSRKDRDTNVRRIGFIADLLTRNGIVAIVSAISPYRAAREEVRSSIASFIEVYVDAPLEVCEHRDPKGLYAQFRAGKLTGITGIDDPYEEPQDPEVLCHTAKESLKVSTDKVLTGVLSHIGRSEQHSVTGSVGRGLRARR